MATPIKAVPILTGDAADEFIRKAEDKASKPRHILSPEQEAEIAEIMRRSREYKFSWEK